MTRTFQEILRHRRSHYALEGASPVSDRQLADLVRLAIEQTPSAFNSQSTRAVLLLHENHGALWDIVLATLRKIVPEAKFAATEEKISRSFAAGYGTALFFEDEAVVADLKAKYPTYAERFDAWSEQTSAMHQMVVWMLLDEVGAGASLQHYNPLIDNAVRERWQLPASWRLVAQMPFGRPLDIPAPREVQPVEGRVLIFG